MVESRSPALRTPRFDRACKARSTLLSRWPKGHQSSLIEWLNGKRPWNLSGDTGGNRPGSRRGSDRSDGEGAQRGRWSPSFLMRDSRVVGLSPSSLAAPAGPRIHQPVWTPGLRYLEHLRRVVCFHRVYPLDFHRRINPNPRRETVLRLGPYRATCRPKEMAGLDLPRQTGTQELPLPGTRIWARG